MVSEAEIFLRLICSVLLGGIIGFEREARHKSAGLRTNTLVCLGSCLIMILSINLYGKVQGLTNADPARLAAQVISGIGFLGAGTIIKEGTTVKGLTTAASLWVVSGIGLAIGSGYYLGAFTTTGLVVIVLGRLLNMIENYFKSNQKESSTSCFENKSIEMATGVFNLKDVSDVIIQDIKVKKQNEQYLSVVIEVQIPSSNKSQENASIRSRRVNEL